MGLKTGFIGRRLLYYPSLPTTMAVARKEARAGAVEGTVVAAEEQTEGRGRLGRGWISPKGNIYLSIILRPSLDLLPSLIMLASLAGVKAIEKCTGLKPHIKWPNDITLKGKKVGGILIENAFSGERVDYTIIGIGINVNFDPALHPEIASSATSLSVELGREISCLELMNILLMEMECLYLRLKSGRDLFGEWRKRLETLGQKVKVLPSGLEGIAEEVARDGSLLLRCDDGSLHRVVAGEVSLRT